MPVPVTVAAVSQTVELSVLQLYLNHLVFLGQSLVELGPPWIRLQELVLVICEATDAKYSHDETGQSTPL